MYVEAPDHVAIRSAEGAAGRPEDDTFPAGRLRRWTCWATVLACLPYLLLKVAWVAGWSVGAQSPTFADTTRVANLVTGGLELVAIAVAVVLVHPYGRRIPAVLVVLPVWVATGLLTPVAAGAALGAPLQLVTGGGNAFAGDDVLSGWVFAVVYLGFSLQAVLLLTGFVLYAADRWPALFSREDSAHDAADEAGATRAVHGLLLGAFAVTSLAFAGQQLWWGLGGGGPFADPETSQRVFLVTGAVLTTAAGAAGLGLLRGRRLGPGRLALVWTGTAVVVTSTLMQTLKSVTIQPGEWGAVEPDPVQGAVTLLVLLAGVAGTIGCLLRVVETAGAAP
jgi:hypothetical protein